MFEGGEGAGKSTVIRAVEAALRDACVKRLVTREPGGTEEGLMLRELLLRGDGPEWDPRAELLLMTAARVQHVRRLIAPALTAEMVVLCDRYFGSTLAYQGAGRGLPDALIRSLHRDAVGGLMPDLTVLLDVDPRVGLKRSASRLAAEVSGEGRFEALDLAFHDRVRASFLDQAQHTRTVLIDAGADVATVTAAAVEAVLDSVSP